MLNLPKYLYRGDSDSNGERKLKDTFKSGLLLSNLSNGGKGEEIFNLPLSELINNHVGIGWRKTHFLSFSEDEATAMNYGSNLKPSYEVYNDEELWDFSIITFDTTLLIKNSIATIKEGIYAAQFNPLHKEFLPTCKIILVDVVAHLKSTNNSGNISTSLFNAYRDKEWLILPTSPFGHHGQYTSKLDEACVREKRIFRYEI